MQSVFLRGKVLCQETGVSADTLRRWADAGRVRCQRINGDGKRFYHGGDVRAMFSKPGAVGAIVPEKAKIAYARVSSAKQQEDLQRQITALRTAYPGHELVSDIGSGLNWRRKGLQAVLERALRGMVAEVVVMHKDRLCRFGFELLEWLLQKSGGKLLVHSAEHDECKSHEQELAEDLLAIVTVFAARSHGKRKYGARKEAGSAEQHQEEGEEEQEPKRRQGRPPKRRRTDGQTGASAAADKDAQDSNMANRGAAPESEQVDGRRTLDLQQDGGRSDASNAAQAGSARKTRDAQTTGEQVATCNTPGPRVAPGDAGRYSGQSVEAGVQRSQDAPNFETQEIPAKTPAAEGPLADNQD